MSKELKVLFLGDIVGRTGREVTEKFLSEYKSNYDFVIANVENASHGFGLTKKNYGELTNIGIDCMTSGNHIWDKKEIYSYIDEAPTIIRPLNYHKTAPGVGYRFFNDKFLVINLLGKTFMNPINCPFVTLEETLSNIKDEIRDKIIIIDFHAEATAEKICLGKFAEILGVHFVVGTHTHVQTSDEKILNERCAYITDAGCCGAYDSVIGMEYEASVRHLITSMPERFEVEANSKYSQINGVEVIFKDNTPKEITRINKLYEVKNEH